MNPLTYPMALPLHMSWRTLTGTMICRTVATLPVLPGNTNSTSSATKFPENFFYLKVLSPKGPMLFTGRRTRSTTGENSLSSTPRQRFWWITISYQHIHVSWNTNTSEGGKGSVNLCGLIHTTKPYDSTSRKQILYYYMKQKTIQSPAFVALASNASCIILDGPMSYIDASERCSSIVAVRRLCDTLRSGVKGQVSLNIRSITW